MSERPFGVDTSTSFINGVECVNADFHVGTDVTDPSYVNTGTGCANGKVTIKQWNEQAMIRDIKYNNFIDLAF